LALPFLVGPFLFVELPEHAGPNQKKVARVNAIQNLIANIFRLSIRFFKKKAKKISFLEKCFIEILLNPFRKPPP